MNKKNLMLGFNHVLLNVKDEQFNIGSYREGREGEACLNSHECNTVGCFIGHCTVLDKKENFLSNIDFQNWALYFFSLGYDELSFLFSGVYACFQDNNQRIQALLRVKYFIENGKIHHDFHTRKFKILMKEEELKPYEISIREILSEEEYNFVKQVYENCGCKMNTEACYQYSEAPTGSHIPLWETPERLGIIEAVGSYKWELTDRVKTSLSLF